MNFGRNKKHITRNTIVDETTEGKNKKQEAHCRLGYMGNVRFS